MKALRVLSARQLELMEVPDPVAGRYEVEIRVQAVGICGTDLEIIGGHMAYYTNGMAALPVTIGHEWVGEIVTVGEGVESFQPGERVVGEVSIGCMNCDTCKSGAYHRCVERSETGVMNRDGGLAERIVLPVRAVHRISKDVDLLSAALVEPSAVAFSAARIAGVGAASFVAVIGDGPIGLLLLQVARALGAGKVCLVGADTARLAVAEQLGADAVIDSRFEDVPEVLRNAGEGRQPDILLEATGNPAALDAAIASAAPGAIIVLQGLCGCMPQTGFDLDRIVINELTLRGALGSPGVWPDVIELIESGKINPAAIVTHDMPMQDFAKALEIVRAREAIKLILRPNGSAVTSL